MTLLEQIQLTINKIRMQIENIQTENGKKLLEFCLKNEGKSFGNKYVDVGCVDELNAVANLALGFQIGGGYSTYLLYQALQDKKRFMEVSRPIGGEIVVSPTGYGNGIIKNGHTGFYVGDNRIMSNDSRDGKLKKNYTLKSWRERFVTQGGFPMRFYRVL